MRRVLALLVAILCLGALAAAPASAREPEFPVFSTPGRNFDQSPSSVPGGRPFELIDTFALNQTPTLEGIVGPAANLRALSVELPPGIVANAASFPRCSQEAFAAADCPTLTQIGVEEPELNVALPGTVVPVFNLAPPPGHPAQFAFRALGGAVHVDFTIRGGIDYGAGQERGGAVAGGQQVDRAPLVGEDVGPAALGRRDDLVGALEEETGSVVRQRPAGDRGAGEGRFTVRPT